MSPISSLPAGGTRNRTLMAELQGRLPGVMLRSIEEFGIPEAAKEALVFAVIGFLSLNGLPATVPSCTGARRATVLGSITPGSDRDLPPCACRRQSRRASRGAHAARLEMSGGRTEMGEARQRSDEPLLSFRERADRDAPSRPCRARSSAVWISTFRPGEKLGIVGESGSGKTLTVLSVLRLLPDPPIRLLGGTITFAGQDLGGARRERAREGPRGRDSHGLPGPDDLAESRCYG